MKQLLSIVFLLSLTIFQIQAQTISTDRPDQSDGATTVPKGSLQIESGVSLAFSGISDRTLVAPLNLFRLGLSNRIELRVIQQIISAKDFYGTITGMGDIEVGTKISLTKKAESNTQMALLAHVIIPSGSSAFANDKMGLVFKFALSQSLSERSGIGLNLGYANYNDDWGDLLYTLAYYRSINDKIGLFLEVYGSAVNMRDDSLSFDTGMTYLFRDNLQFDFTFGTGISERHNYVTAGVCWGLFKN